MEANNLDVLILEDLSTAPNQNPPILNKKPPRRKRSKAPAKNKQKRTEEQQKKDQQLIKKQPSLLNYIYKLEYELSDQKRKMKEQKKIFKQFFHSVFSLFVHFDKDGGIEYDLLSKYIDNITPKEGEPFFSRTLELIDFPKPKGSASKRKRGSGLGRGRPRKSTTNNVLKMMKERDQYGQLGATPHKMMRNGSMEINNQLGQMASPVGNGMNGGSMNNQNMRPGGLGMRDGIGIMPVGQNGEYKPLERQFNNTPIRKQRRKRSKKVDGSLKIFQQYMVPQKLFGNGNQMTDMIPALNMTKEQKDIFLQNMIKNFSADGFALPNILKTQ